MVDDRYVRTGTTVSDQSLNTVFISDSRPSVVESISLNNLENITVPVTLIITDETDVVKGYLTSNLRIPPKASVEVCEYPKTIPVGYKIKAHKFAAGEMSVFTSSKYTAQYTIENSTGVINEGQSVIFDVTTLGVNPGTTLYYTVEGTQGNVTAQDFVTPMEGSFVVGDGAARITVTANLDQNVDIEGDEIFKVYVRTNSNVGTIVATSSSILIKDISNISPYSATEDITLTYFGNSNISVFVTGINNTENIYYEIEEI
jgi:plastocyanin